MERSKEKLPLYFDLQLIADANGVLKDTETLSEFVERSLREAISFRQVERGLLERGLASRDEARNTGRYVTFEEVLSRLDQVLSSSKSRKKLDEE